MDRFCLYLHYARNTSYAAADGSIFRTIFYFGIRISMGYSLIAVFIAFAINYAAYFAEIYRGGIESMPVVSMKQPESLATQKHRPSSASFFPRYLNGFCHLLPTK